MCCRSQQNWAWQVPLPFLETVLTPFFHLYIHFRAFCGSWICLQSSKKRSFYSQLKNIFLPADVHMLLGRSRLSLGCRAEQKCHDSLDRKRIRADLWRPEPFVLAAATWEELILWLVRGGQLGSGHHPNHWQFRSNGKQGSLERTVSRKKYSSVYLPQNDKRLLLHREVSGLQICQQKCGGLAHRQQEEKPEQTRWDAQFYDAERIFDPNTLILCQHPIKLLTPFENTLRCDFSWV